MTKTIIFKNKIMNLLLFIISIFWAVGLSFPKTWWYIGPGITIGDLLFILIIIPFIFFRKSYFKFFHIALKQQSLYFLFASLFSLWLIISALINLNRFGFYFGNFFIALRQIYYVVITAIIIILVLKNKKNILLNGLLFGAIFSSAILVFYAFDGIFTNPINKFPTVGSNVLGGILALLFPTLLLKLTKTKTIKKSIICFLILFSYLFIVLLTRSKGCWLTIGFVFLIMAPFLFRKYKILSLLIIISITISVLYIPYKRIYQSEIMASRLSVQVRKEYALSGLSLAFQYPIFGIGTKNYRELSSQPSIKTLTKSPDPHNTYIHVAVGSGLIGFLLFLPLFFFPLFQLIKYWKKLEPNYRITYLATLCAIYLYGMFIGEMFTQHLSWVLIAIILGDITKNKLKFQNKILPNQL